MGLILTNKEKEVCIGYLSFGFIRQSIANAYDEKIGLLYKKMYSPLFEKYTDEENKYLDGHIPKCLDEFLYHSDCDGYFKSESVKGIYEELQKLKPSFQNENLKQKYTELLDLFKDGERIDLF